MKVGVFQPIVPHYRVDLLNALDHELKGSLTVFSQPVDGDGFIDGMDRLRPPFRLAKTWRFGPLWCVPSAVREAARPGWSCLIFSWNARQIELTLALLVARWRGTPTALWGHGLGRSRSRFALIVRRWQVKLASGVLTYSEGGRQEVRSLVPEADVRIVRNTTGRPLVSPENCIDQPAFRVGYVGRLYAEKRLERLVEAVSVVRRNGVDIRLGILGTGPAESYVRTFAKQLDMDTAVDWHKGTEDWSVVASFISSLDIAVFPEIGGLGVVDAMANGRPSIVLDSAEKNPPEAENVIDGITGLRYNPATSAGLAKAIHRAYGTVGLLQRMSHGAAQYYSEHLLLEHAVESFASAVKDWGRKLE